MGTAESVFVGRWRALIQIALFALLVFGASIALDALARSQLRSQLLAESQATLGALVHGDTPHRWAMTDPDELVSGTAFGTSFTEVDASGTRVTGSGGAVELGLRLDRVVDLRRFPIVQANLESSAATRIALVVRESLDGPLCTSAASELSPGDSTWQVDVVELAWTCDGIPHNAPTRAAMLRLRVDLENSAQMRAGEVRLLPMDPMARAEMAAAVPAIVHSLARSGEMPIHEQPAPAHRVGAAWPIFALVLDGRVEQSMRTIDRIRDARPAAIIVADGDWQTAVGKAGHWMRVEASSPWLPWVLVVAQGLAMLWIRMRPLATPQLQSAAELIGVLAVPLILVAGGWIGNDLDAAVVASLALTLLFAASLLRGSVAPRQPAARARMRGWSVALATVLASIVIVLVLRDGSIAPNWPTAGTVARYLAWAAVQQLLIGVIVADRFERIFGSALWAIPASALVFALLHTPNAMLMQFTLLGGIVWVWNWQRHRALLANTIAHTLSGLLLATQLPAEWLRSAEVSARYFFF